MEVKQLEEKKGKMTVEEAGRKGGQKTAETHGEDFYSEIGRKGGKIGGSKGGQRVRKLIEEGKEHENE
jgi:general stress protein YciG